jgi:hypothetical protein
MANGSSFQRFAVASAVQRSRPPRPSKTPAIHPGPDMLDAIFLLASAAFFALSLAYVAGCDRL